MWRAATSSYNSMLRIAPERPDGLPSLVALTKTCTACPSQWEGILEDGRAVYARYHHGELSVGIGDDIDEAVHNGADPPSPLLRLHPQRTRRIHGRGRTEAHLHGLLKFPAELVVENERPAT
jgi:hypothetical protein